MFDEVQFDGLRSEMVHDQVWGRGIRSPSVLRAMTEVPRHYFVPPAIAEHAYDDGPLSIGYGQTISQPYMVGLMTELLNLGPEDRVLEIGAGSGYQAAVLGSIAAAVVTIERQPYLVQRARRILYELDHTNIVVLYGDGTLGCAECGPYDAILVTAGSPAIPPSLTKQLTLGGRLVCPVGSRKRQEIVRLTRTASGLREERGVPCVFVPLIGREGWRD